MSNSPEPPPSNPTDSTKNIKTEDEKPVGRVIDEKEKPWNIKPDCVIRLIDNPNVELNAHKSVLSKASPIIEAWFLVGLDNNAFESEFDLEITTFIRDYAYNYLLPIKSLPFSYRLVEAACRFEIKSLINECCAYWAQKLDRACFKDIMYYGSLYNLNIIIDKCLKYIFRKCTEHLPPTATTHGPSDGVFGHCQLNSTSRTYKKACRTAHQDMKRPVTSIFGSTIAVESTTDHSSGKGSNETLNFTFLGTPSANNTQQQPSQQTTLTAFPLKMEVDNNPYAGTTASNKTVGPATVTAATAKTHLIINCELLEQDCCVKKPEGIIQFLSTLSFPFLFRLVMMYLKIHERDIKHVCAKEDLTKIIAEKYMKEQKDFEMYVYRDVELYERIIFNYLTSLSVKDLVSQLPDIFNAKDFFTIFSYETLFRFIEITYLNSSLGIFYQILEVICLIILRKSELEKISINELKQTYDFIDCLKLHCIPLSQLRMFTTNVPNFLTNEEIGLLMKMTDDGYFFCE